MDGGRSSLKSRDERWNGISIFHRRIGSGSRSSDGRGGSSLQLRDQRSTITPIINQFHSESRRRCCGTARLEYSERSKIKWSESSGPISAASRAHGSYPAALPRSRGESENNCAFCQTNVGVNQNEWFRVKNQSFACVRVYSMFRRHTWLKNSYCW